MKELRCIVFTDREVITAITERRRRMREALPSGTVIGARYAEADGLQTTLVIVDDHGRDLSIPVPEPEVAAALLAYCMGRKVPLPADADKVLYLINGALTLMITMNFNKAPRMSAARPRRSLPAA
ncbi:MAG TPA: hypothetical protein VEH84_04820 [Alphaproteobacteria bacterium]|nr:hypothetical protein [Alphaproteobacteria bacterium]